MSTAQRSLLRQSRGIFYRNNRKGNLNKKHFLMAGSWVGVLSVFSRSSVGEIGVNIREDTETSILIKRTFSFLYYCFNISKVTCAAKPLIRTSSPLASRLIAYSSNAADFILSLLSSYNFETLRTYREARGFEVRGGNAIAQCRKRHLLRPADSDDITGS